MRIVAGRFGGRRLAAPGGQSTRPTSGRTRESLFNLLSNRIDFDGLRVIDLFAGSGALGLEALSRGASFALFVETAAPARAAIRTNIEALGVQGCTSLYRRDATALGLPGTLAPFDLAFLDPPYAKRLGEAAIGALVDGGWLNDSALVILEEGQGNLPAELPPGLEALDERRYAGTAIGLYRFTKN